MRQIARASTALALFVVLSGMDCQGNAPLPMGDPSGPQDTPTGPLIIKSITSNAADDKLYITGEFGNTRGAVTCGGFTLNIDSWSAANGSSQQIVCDLPREASSDVQVRVGTAVSNVAQLTKWELHLLSKTTQVALHQQTGQTQIEIKLKLIVRACLNNLSGSTTPSFDVPASLSRASLASVDASGTVVSNSGSNYSYTLLSVSPQEFRIRYPEDMVDPNGEKFVIDGIFCGATRGTGGGLKVNFFFRGMYRAFERGGSVTTVSELPTSFSTYNYFDASLPVNFAFDGNFNIAAGSVPSSTNSSSTLSWQPAAPYSPPRD